MCDFEEKLKSLETTLSEFEQEILADPKSAFNRQACDFKKGEVRQEVNNAQKIMAQAVKEIHTQPEQAHVLLVCAQRFFEAAVDMTREYDRVHKFVSSKGSHIH